MADSRSELERKFLDALAAGYGRLPNQTQKPIAEASCVADFWYEPNMCVFCDGAAHDEPEQRAKDAAIRAKLRAHGYRVIEIRYDRNMREQFAQHPEVFGKID